MLRPLDSISYSKFDLVYHTYSEKSSISISSFIFLFLPFLRLKWLLKFTYMSSRSLYLSFFLSVLVLIYFTIHSHFPLFYLSKSSHSRYHPFLKSKGYKNLLLSHFWIRNLCVYGHSDLGLNHSVYSIKLPTSTSITNFFVYSSIPVGKRLLNFT